MISNNSLNEDNEAIFSQVLLDLASDVLRIARAKGVRIAVAETVTSGLASACLTSVPGASEVFERGYILYHSSAKSTGLDIPEAVSATYGAVSAEVTQGLAKGLLSHSQAYATLAITGYAGPGGGNENDPVGTIYIAAANRDGALTEERHVFNGNRDSVRLQAIKASLAILKNVLPA